jgi:hypothetical protein
VCVGVVWCGVVVRVGRSPSGNRRTRKYQKPVFSVKIPKNTTTKARKNTYYISSISMKGSKKEAPKNDAQVKAGGRTIEVVPFTPPKFEVDDPAGYQYATCSIIHLFVH